MRRLSRFASPAGLMTMLALALVFVACEREPGAEAEGDAAWTDEPVGSQDWLAGPPQEKFETIADQFAGFSAAMMEVGYRYNELYFAGQDENWQMATYHAEKIGDAIALGFERRPARAESAMAQSFMDNVLPEMLEAIETQDPEQFEISFEDLRNNCNACHQVEEMGHLEMRTPVRRLYPWGSMDEYEAETDTSYE